MKAGPENDHEAAVFAAGWGERRCGGEEGVLWIGETDTSHRAGYLWECRL